MLLFQTGLIGLDVRNLAEAEFKPVPELARDRIPLSVMLFHQHYLLTHNHVIRLPVNQYLVIGVHAQNLAEEVPKRENAGIVLAFLQVIYPDHVIQWRVRQHLVLGDYVQNLVTAVSKRGLVLIIVLVIWSYPNNVIRLLVQPLVLGVLVLILAEMELKREHVRAFPKHVPYIVTLIR